MANSFSKEERVAFEDLLEGFNDALVLSKNVSMYRTNSTEMARTNDIIWRPQPYIAQSYDGMDQSLNFQNMTQLSVPATLGFKKSVPWIMDALELRDALQEGRLGDSAKQKLASDINLAIMAVAANQGSLVVPIGTDAGTYDDVAACDTIMNEQGVQAFDRYLGLSSRDYNGMAGNLATATRSFGNQISDQAPPQWQPRASRPTLTTASRRSPIPRSRRNWLLATPSRSLASRRCITSPSSPRAN
jgi:hypothetical protein